MEQWISVGMLRPKYVDHLQRWEVIPNIPVRRNWNEPFHFNSNQNFQNLWHNGKHPLYASFISMKWQGELLLLRGWVASPLQGYYNYTVTFLNHKQAYSGLHWQNVSPHSCLHRKTFSPSQLIHLSCNIHYHVPKSSKSISLATSLAPSCPNK